MDNKIVINLEIANKVYGLTIRREEEEIARKAAKQIRKKMVQYRQLFPKAELATQDLLAMTAIQCSMSELQLGQMNDPAPFVEKIKQLNSELEEYLKGS